MKVLVIPTNRPERIPEFFAQWQGRGGWDKVIICHDAPVTETLQRFGLSGDYIVLCWQDIELLADRGWIISRKNSGIRALGFLKAYNMGADYVLTLDDDTGPSGDYSEVTFFDQHINNMNNFTRWTESVPGIRTRGLPYKNRGTLKSVVNIGLWNNVADFDAPQSLGYLPYFQSPPGSRIIARDQYVPMCTMNLCFTREAIPLMYQPLMGNESPYDRFDDIWSGIIVKKICDSIGYCISVGEPHVEHKRASDPFVNLIKEATGIVANEKLWEVIDQATISRDALPIGAMFELGEFLKYSSDTYIKQLGNALGEWATLFVA